LVDPDAVSFRRLLAEVKSGWCVDEQLAIPDVSV
jgi:hypothetical protein